MGTGEDLSQNVKAQGIRPDCWKDAEPQAWLWDCRGGLSEAVLQIRLFYEE